MNEEVIKEKKPRGITKFAAYIPVKIISFLAIIFFTAATLVGSIFLIDMWEAGVFSTYGTSFKETVNSRFDNIARLNANMIASYIQGNEYEQAESFILSRNIAAVKIKYIEYPYDVNGNRLNQYEFYLNDSYKENPPTDYVCKGNNGDIEWTIYLIPGLPMNDAYLSTYKSIAKLYDLRYLVVGAEALSVLLLLINIIIFLIGIGRDPDKNEIIPNAATKIPFDLFSVVMGTVVIVLGLITQEASYSSVETIAVVLFGVICILLLLWFVNIVHRIKLRNLFSNTLCWMLIKLSWKLICNFSLIWQAFTVITAVSLIEFFAIVFIGLAGREVTALIVLFLWFIEKCFIVPLLLYIVLMMKNLFKGGNEIAAGNLDYKINLSGLFGAYKKHGQNLNNLSEVINNSVSEKLKSERMKSELVTNVSHDLKTPLTSIINYSDLIQTEADNLIKEKEADHANTNTDNADNISAHLANIEDYSGVLNRQSKKLKRLLDDLVDISKANSGNMEVIIEKINVATILSQAIGEYEERFEEKNLEVITNGIDEDIYVKADSRKLWRVVDNLLQNIYKYALSGTRVFFNAEKNDGKVNIIFKNTSRDIIIVSAEELSERFTRNDESRHTEGNGLGLAIAKTMAELQGGDFKIEVDGDLFKVTLTLEEYISVPQETEERT